MWCGYCKFWYEHDSGATSGTCHRYPPTWKGTSGQAHFPRVDDTQGCGEYELDKSRVPKQEEE